MEINTRRALIKRLGAIAVAGYVAPKVTTIKPVRAGSECPSCGPPCGSD